MVGLIIVGALVLVYARLSPGTGAAGSASPPAWVPIPTATAAPSQPTPASSAPPPAAPSPTAVIATPKPAGPTKHTVQPGETLSQIAERYGVSMDAIVSANSLVDRDNLKLGQELTIPAPTRGVTPVAENPQATPAAAPPAPSAPTQPAAPAGPTRYKVAGGDTLNSIAQKFGVTLAAIIQANNLNNADDISIDQELVIPSP